MPRQTRRRGPGQGPSRVATTQQPLAQQGATPSPPRHGTWNGLADLERQRARARRAAGDSAGAALAAAWLAETRGAA